MGKKSVGDARGIVRELHVSVRQSVSGEWAFFIVDEGAGVVSPSFATLDECLSELTRSVKVITEVRK